MSSRSKATGRWLLGVALVMCLCWWGGDVDAAPSRYSRWTDETALTIAPRSVEVGVVSEAAWAPAPRWELRAHPLSFVLLPHLEAKLRLWDGDRLQLSSRHRISYPTSFLDFLARDGVLGLLPPGTDVPVALLLDQDALFSVEFFRNHWLTASAGASVGLSGGAPEVLLDFPILYQRFAALYSPLVPRATLALSGSVFPNVLHYELSARHRWLLLDEVRDATSTDVNLELHFMPWLDHRFSAAVLWSRALLPVGERNYTLPYVDYRVRF